MNETDKKQETLFEKLWGIAPQKHLLAGQIFGEGSILILRKSDVSGYGSRPVALVEGHRKDSGNRAYLLRIYHDCPEEEGRIEKDAGFYYESDINLDFRLTEAKSIDEAFGMYSQ